MYDISTNMLVISLATGLAALTIFIVVSVIRNEIRRKKWSKNMKVGEVVHFSTSNNVNGEILNVLYDDVEIKVKVKKSLVYPGPSKEQEFIV